jgi:hypothetical protein
MRSERLLNERIGPLIYGGSNELLQNSMILLLYTSVHAAASFRVRILLRCTRARANAINCRCAPSAARLHLQTSFDNAHHARELDGLVDSVCKPRWSLRAFQPTLLSANQLAHCWRLRGKVFVHHRDKSRLGVLKKID